MLPHEWNPGNLSRRWLLRHDGPQKNLQRPALNLFGFAGIDKMTRRQDKRARGKNFRLPMVGKAQVEGGGGHGWPL